MWKEAARRDPTSPHKWAMAHRLVADRPFDYIPAIAAILDDPHPFVVVKKSAQVGLTEAMVNLTLFTADTGHAERGNALYVMPTQNQMDDFAQQRFDRAIQDSPELRARLQPEPPRRKGADSKRLKHLGKGWLFMRGSENRGQIASVDADLVVLDEFDQMADGTLPLAQKRLASSRRPLLRVISTPRFPETGIDALYRESDQRHYLLRCRHCDEEQPLTWAENVDEVRMLVVCRRCRTPIDVRRPGRWSAQAPGNDRIHGYHLNRLYSRWADIPAMVEASRAVSAQAQQEFHNSDLGEVFSPPGSGLTMDILDRARAEYGVDEYRGAACVMGVDVGSRFHVVVRGFSPPARRASGHRRSYASVPQRYIDTDTGRPPVGIASIYGVRDERTSAAEDRPEPASRLWYAADLGSIAEVEALLERFRVTRCVVDMQPETHLVVDFARRHAGRVVLARYGRQDPGHESSTEHGVRILKVNRNEAIEESVARFVAGMNELPGEARQLGGHVTDGLGEYYREAVALRRVILPDASGNWESRWVGTGDHYAHAEVYASLAMWIERGGRPQSGG